jgi:hypothetical protein
LIGWGSDSCSIAVQDGFELAAVVFAFGGFGGFGGFEGNVVGETCRYDGDENVVGETIMGRAADAAQVCIERPGNWIAVDGAGEL